MAHGGAILGAQARAVDHSYPPQRGPSTVITPVSRGGSAGANPLPLSSPSDHLTRLDVISSRGHTAPIPSRALIGRLDSVDLSPSFMATTLISNKKGEAKALASGAEGSQ